MWDPYAQFVRSVFPNGVTSLHSLYLPDRPWIKVRLIVHCGAEKDPRGKEGLSHFVEHLVSKNGPEPYLEMHRYFASLGGYVRFGTTSYHATWYEFSVPAEHDYVLRAFNLFGAMLCGNRLSAGVEHERGVITREFHRLYKLSFQYEQELLKRSRLFPGMWQSRMTSPLGTLESIASITESDLQDHYERYYTPANIEVVSVGGLSGEDLCGIVSQVHAFSQVSHGIKQARPPFLVQTPLPLVPSYQVRVSDFVKQTTHATAYGSACLVPYSSRGVFPCIIAASMLEQALLDVLRFERGLVYSISVNRFNHRDMYEININASGIEPTKIDVVVGEVDRVLADLSDKEDLFEQIRGKTIRSMRMSDLSGGDILDEASGDLIRWGYISSFAEDIRQYSEVRMDDVNRVLEALHPSRRLTITSIP